MMKRSLTGWCWIAIMLVTILSHTILSKGFRAGGRIGSMHSRFGFRSKPLIPPMSGTGLRYKQSSENHGMKTAGAAAAGAAAGAAMGYGLGSLGRHHHYQHGRFGDTIVLQYL
nr:PREDICTED: shadow of prion protein-like [Latimeria chalumnae]|eukprot:XP_006009712.1 PREDICTED: shadow of prion protein-like [Latimeria chalumnae]